VVPFNSRRGALSPKPLPIDLALYTCAVESLVPTRLLDVAAIDRTRSVASDILTTSHETGVIRDGSVDEFITISAAVLYGIY
jgi:hypothetical protein